MILSLPDPRRYGPGEAHDPLLARAAGGASAELIAAVRALLERGDDASVARSLSLAPSRQAYADLWNAVCAAVEQPAPDAAVAMRVFAIPWLIVCGAKAAASLPCTIADVGELTETLQKLGALGANRTAGFSNALCSLDALESLAPSAVLRWSAGGGAPELPPAAIDIAPGAESVHVRFLPGAAVAVAHAPSIVESMADISPWGIPLTRAMAQRLALSGVDVLPMPRPPASLLRAAHAGRRAGIELAFTLFLSNTLRRFRMKVGEPVLVASAHEGGEVRVNVCTPFDDAMTEGFRWPLHPLDALPEVAGSIAALAEECRVMELRSLPRVQPDFTPTGAVYFPGLETAGFTH